ncbi:hydantoinase B/oxoprolinase family protein, partial [Comamonadaceae bacterium G21597-S1]|nr:hydantoinase B/oxoprolinase family protein [Comamonadaceae bacterium G21597-S1]
DPVTHRFVLVYEGLGVGFGARSFADGIDAVYFLGQKNYPIEFIENEFPVRILRYGMHVDSAGPGRWRGGLGIVRDIEFLGEEGNFARRMDGAIFPPWGVNGGQGGRKGRVIINPGTEREEEISTVGDGFVLRRGDVVRFMTTGGGGWGHPAERPVELVQRDVECGFVSLEGARRDYGVVMDAGTRTVDEHATSKLRHDLLSQPTDMFHRNDGYFSFKDEVTSNGNA